MAVVTRHIFRSLLVGLLVGLQQRSRTGEAMAAASISPDLACRAVPVRAGRGRREVGLGAWRRQSVPKLVGVVAALAAVVGLAHGECVLPEAPAGTGYVGAKGCGPGESMPGNGTQLPVACEIACLPGFGEVGAAPGHGRRLAALGAAAVPPPPPPAPAPTTAFTCDGKTLSSPTLKCAACDTGTYKPLQGNAECTDCPQFSTSSGTGATAISGCECKPGYSGTLSKPGDQCTPCAAGTFGTGGTAATCTPCPANAVTEGTASKTASDCVCDLGYTGTVTTPTSKCVACPQSQYKSATGAAACSACPANSDTAAGAAPATAVSQCLCSAGYSGAITAPASKCTACESGMYKDADGPSSCEACPLDSDTQGQAGSDKITACVCKAGSTYAGHVLSSPVDACAPSSSANGWEISQLASIGVILLMGLALSYMFFWRPATANERAVQRAQVQNQADLEARLADLVQLLTEIPPETLATARRKSVARIAAARSDSVNAVDPGQAPDR